MFVRAALFALLGLDPAPPEVPGVLGASLGANDRRQEYLRATVAWRDDGRLEATPAPHQDSSMLATFARADCLIKRAPFAPAMAPGTPVSLLLLGSGALAV
jgi:molybdopterin molybdotransferase